MPSVTELLKYEPHFSGVETPEPSLKQVLLLYYLKHFSPEEAIENAEHYIKLLEAEFDEHS